ncbi:MAG: Gfo/Idh/MocA family oxidoreductase [Chloroflexi bacterium]|nr:Gfo/Idh/MocA family oxidoreductase [Chloroflexota bacterium]
MKSLRVGIIGLGVGEGHIAGYQSHPDCEVVALCDFSDDKLAMAKRQYPGIRLTSKADELLHDPDIDIVSIASYDNYHYQQIVQAIENDKHIFVEKPLCLYENEAAHIRQLLQQKPALKMSSNLILRLSPRFLQLKRMITDGKLGQLFYVEGDYNYGRLHKITEGWRGKIDFYSVVYGGAVHLVDLLLWLTGDRIVEVAAYGNAIASRGKGFRYNDMVVSILKFESGLIGKVAANFGCVYPHFHALSIYGTRATFVNGLEHATLFESRDPAQTGKKITTPYPGIEKGELIYSFVESILGRSPAEVTVEDIFQTMSVCFAIEKATHQSDSVMVTYI